MATFTNDTKENTPFAGINLGFKVNGEIVNLGSLFTTNKGTTSVAKELQALLESGELQPADLTVQVTGTFSSEDVKELSGASAFKS